MDDIKAKQQIVEKIQSSTNILVTVSNNPSVDALSAMLGLTLLLDKIDKHATAIFSGNIPPAISFLEPEKTFDTSTNSLRDFIIALDKEKADHLRYKVEGDSVKIFITPYKTTITSDDLNFSQGDFNVELVIALGVDNQDHLDGALESHGQILHDAAIITVSAGEQTSTLGGIDWYDPQASSLSEMVVGLAEALKSDKNESLVDASIATAFLTGIVAETDRFSNPHTTARVMTTAAQLMASGADQQLIASKLQESHSISTPSTKISKEDASAVSAKDSLDISHDENETLAELDKRVKGSEATQATPDAASAYAVVDEPASLAGDVSAQVTNAYAPDVDTATPATEPTLGGALNATTEQAADDARREQEDDQNKTLLSHSYISSAPAYSDPTGGASPTDVSSGGIPTILGHEAPIGASGVSDLPPVGGDITNSAYALDPQPQPAIAQPEFVPAPVAPAMPAAPADFGLPMPPPLPDFSQLPPAPIAAPAYGASFLGSTPQAPVSSEILGDILAPEPAVQPYPTTPPVQGPPNPGQFQIPGQQ